MSSMKLHDLQCPHCGNKQKAEVRASLNVTLNPELKKRLYAAEINHFVCEKCGKKRFISAPLLYNDMTQQFCVWYYPPEALDDPNFFRDFKIDGSLAIGDVATYLPKTHIVFDMNEMIRYVTFRDGIASAVRERGKSTSHSAH